jgi:hypothetical protein
MPRRHPPRLVRAAAVAALRAMERVLCAVACDLFAEKLRMPSEPDGPAVETDRGPV